MRLKTFGIIAAALLPVAALTACEPAAQNNRTSVAQSGPVTSTGTAQIGGDYTLVNHRGETVSQADFLGRPQMIYFGFAYCPDVCPMALQKMSGALEILGQDGNAIQPILITVDPERDTVESLAQYVTAGSFPDDLTGLTGTRAQVDQAMAAYKVVAQKVIDPDYPEDYVMDHSSIIYILDAEGKFVGLFTHKDSPQTIADGTRRMLKL